MTAPARNPVLLHTNQRDRARDDRALRELHRQLRLLETGDFNSNQVAVGSLSARFSAVYLAVEEVMRGE